MRTITNLLQKRIVSYLVLLIAIAAKTIQQIYFFVPTPDRAIQLVQAKNFLLGHGLTINKIAQNASEIYVRIPFWPPGYPVIISGISLLFHLSILNAAILFDVFSAILFVFFSRKTLMLLTKDQLIINLYTLLIAFFIYDFFEFPASDLNALAFYLIALYILLVILKKGNASLYSIIAFVILNFIPSTIKFLYVPIAFIGPAYLIFTGFKTNNPFIKKAGIYTLAFTIVLIASFILFQKIYTGSSAYLAQNTIGYFFENLYYYYHIIISSLTNIPFDFSIASSLDTYHLQYIYAMVWALNLYFTCFLIQLFFRYLNSRKSNQFSLRDHFIILNGFASMFLLLELTYLSIRYQSLPPWTYLKEPRYMALIVVFLQQLYFITLFEGWRKLESLLIRICRLAIAFLFIFEFLHGLYFTSKVISKSKDFKMNNSELSIMNNISNHIQFFKNHNAENIYFYSSNTTFSNIASLQNAKCFYSLSGTTNRNLYNGKNSFIIVLEETESLPNDLNYSTRKIIFLDSIGSYKIYGF